MLWWSDLRDFVANLPPNGDSALYRLQFPQSWWWSPQIEFLGAVLTAVQWGNWQRGGGRGDKPKSVQRPVDKPKSSAVPPKSAAELEERKKALKETMERTQGGN